MANNPLLSHNIAGAGGSVQPGGDGNMVGSVLGKIKSMLPDTSNLYLEPLDPATEMSPSDRASLIWQSARPWGEFFDFTKFNLPPWEQVGSRLGHNIDTYFYNYFLLACVHMILFSFTHFAAVIVLFVWLGFMYYLYMSNPDDIEVTDSITITSRLKLVLAVVTGIIALTVGHVLTLVFSVTIFLLIFVTIHGLIRDDTVDPIPDF